MQRLSAFTFASLVCFTGLLAQTCDIVVFSDAGEKFTLVIDGDVKNDAPAARVVATGIKNETPMLIVNFATAGIPPIKQNSWMDAGQEYTLRITTNKKGVRVLRLQGQAPLGTAIASDKPSPSNFIADDATDEVATPTTYGTDVQVVSTPPVRSSTTVTTTEGSTGQSVNMNIGVNGMGMNVGVKVDDGMDGSSTTTTTTTTTTHSQSGTVVPQAPKAPVEETVVTTTGCTRAMNPSDFQDAKTSISAKGFEDTKLTLAKQIGGSNCFSSDQVKSVMGLFGFEDSKLDFAKFAYDHVIDVNNYYKVNDAFKFSSSVDELNKYIQGR